MTEQTADTTLAYTGFDPDDEGLRETSVDKLASLAPIREGGLHTAGTSSQISVWSLTVSGVVREWL